MRVCKSSEIEKLVRAKAVATESATASAPLDGKIWCSVGSRENMIQSIEVSIQN